MTALYLLDTNILVHLVRGDALGQRIQATYAPLMAERRPLISVVTDGELRSLTYQFDWGNERLEQVLFLLGYFQRMPIDTPDVLRAYVVIDADSRRNGRRMGKNDLWIAATTHVTGATLLTSDEDFDHLDPVFLSQVRVHLTP